MLFFSHGWAHHGDWLDLATCPRVACADRPSATRGAFLAEVGEDLVSPVWAGASTY
jgi:hypothetical protein